MLLLLCTSNACISFSRREWGSWVDVKNGAANVLKRELHRAKAKGPVTILCPQVQTRINQ